MITIQEWHALGLIEAEHFWFYSPGSFITGQEPIEVAFSRNDTWLVGLRNVIEDHFKVVLGYYATKQQAEQVALTLRLSR